VNENYNPQDIYQEEAVDYKALFFKFYRHWYFFVVTIFIALVIAFLFNKYTKPIYEVSTTLLIEDKSSSDAQSLLGLGFRNNMQNLENEIGKLKSYKLSLNTIKKLDFDVSYYGEENFIAKELYKESPFIVEYDTSHYQTLTLNFNININSASGFVLAADGENLDLYDYRTDKKVEGEKLDLISINESHTFGEWIETDHYKFRILLSPKFDAEKDLNKKMYFIFNSTDGLVGRFKGFEIEPINKESSIIEIKLKGSNVEKSTDFLNMLTTVYLDMELDKKNRIALKTIEFIDEQLITITSTLDSAQMDLQNFRMENEVMNMDFQSSQVFEQMMELTDKKAELLLSDKYYQSLKEYILKNQDQIDDIIVPSALGINDPVTSSFVTSLIEMYQERAEKLYTVTKKNPTIIQVDIKINNQKKALLENIDNLVNASQIAINDIDDRIRILTTEINKLPLTQRMLFNMERHFQLSNTMYTYLLKKRSEAQITAASNQPDNEIIDAARKEAAGSPVYPKKSLNYLIALVLGVVLPVGYILGKDFMNDKVIERKDIESITNLPIIGHTIHSSKESKIVVATSPKSSISESFRSIRTNLQYLAQGKEQQTILITSDMVGAG
jgi:uncharacterized protein involved in exopolysaccharide biosynthesis